MVTTVEEPLEKAEAEVMQRQRKHVSRPDRAYLRTHMDLDSIPMFNESLREATTYHIFHLTSKGQGVKQLALGILTLGHQCDPIKAFLEESVECFHAVL